MKQGMWCNDWPPQMSTCLKKDFEVVAVTYTAPYSVGGNPRNDMVIGRKYGMVGTNMRKNLKPYTITVICAMINWKILFYLARITDTIQEKIDIWNHDGGLIWNKNYHCNNLTRIICEGDDLWNILVDLCKKRGLNHLHLFMNNRTSVGAPTKYDFKEAISEFLIAYRKRLKLNSFTIK